jgi:hypothetical protein
MRRASLATLLAIVSLGVAACGSGTATPPATGSSVASAGRSPTPGQHSGTFIATGSMAIARTGHTATLLQDGRVLVTGGYVGTLGLLTAELYNPATGTWSLTGAMTARRLWHTATLLPDGRVLIVGGTGSFEPLVSAELYEP